MINFELSKNQTLMKKLIAVVFLVSLMVVLFAGCRLHQTCPAYHNGSVQKAVPAEDTRA